MADSLNAHRHFLQTSAWAAFQKALGKQVIERSNGTWHYLAVLEAPTGFGSRMHRRLYVPYGPTCQTEAALGEALKDLLEEAKRLSVAYVRVEPVVLNGSQEIDMRRYGGEKKARSYQPDRTLLIDLNQDESLLIKAMSSTNRNLWNTYAAKGMQIRKSYSQKDLPAFLGMMHTVAQRKGIIVHDDDYFEKMAAALFPSKAGGLIFVEYESKPIMTAMFYDNLEGGTRYYAHAGSYEEARKLQANSPLVTYLMMDAKKQGFKTFDLYGVSPEGDLEHAWAGHSKFKRSFGGSDYEYLGTWEIPADRLKYSLAKLSRLIKR